MTESPAPRLDATGALGAVVSLRTKVREDRYGHWFPLVVFGVLTLASAPLYWRWPLPASDCHRAGGFTSCGFIEQINLPLGGALGTGSFPIGPARWLTVYWVAALVVGYAATIAFARRHGHRVGVRVRVGPTIGVGLGLLAVVLLVNGAVPSVSRGHLFAGDIWVRGMGSLLILAVGLGALAVVERSRPFMVYVAGFIGLALVACLYDIVNIFYRLGIGVVGGPNGTALPNIVLPGLYLLGGGIGFWYAARRRENPGGAPARFALPPQPAT
jgi:hypothetical protein